MRGVSSDVRAFYYTGPYTSSLPPHAEEILARLAPARRARFAKQLSTPQRAVGLAAWRLLELGMERCGYARFRLADVVHPLDAKPYWPADAPVDFSLSHARGIALCAIGAACKVGCDAEERKRIEPRLTQRLVADDAARMPCWTELEAVVKGAGQGIMHGRDIVWTEHEAHFAGKTWWPHPIDCGPLHAAHVAVDRPDVRVIVAEVAEL